MKKCGRCKLELPEYSFNWKNKKLDKRSSECKSCKKLIQNDWYKKNKEIHKKNVRENKLERFADEAPILRSMKNKPCSDCGQKFPFYAMDWDHRPGEIKCGNIAQMTLRTTFTKVLEEIAKCDLVCSNCHRIRTYKRNPKKYRY